MSIGKRRPVLVTTSSTHLVWLDDDDDEGAAVIAKRLQDQPDDLAALLDGSEVVDGDVECEPALSEYTLHGVHGAEHGPWQTCPFPGCTRLQYPGYGVDLVCWQHTVTGCQRHGLPERYVEEPACP